MKGLEATGRQVRNPEQVFCSMDHIVDTFPGRSDETLVPGGSAFIKTTREAALAAGEPEQAADVLAWLDRTGFEHPQIQSLRTRLQGGQS